MSEPLHTRAQGSSAGQPGIDRDAKIEQLLVAGLDHYFAARYDDAIHVWTRALFLDRGHARARAYIERARRALAERGREAEELLHTGVAAFNRGDVEAARRLLQSVVARGGGHEEAQALLDRLTRLERPGGVSARVSPATGASMPTARQVRGAGAGRARAVRRLPLLALAALSAATLVALGAREPLESLLRFPASAPSVGTPSQRLEALPLPSPADIAVGRARRLFEEGRSREALRALERLGPGGSLRGEADALREAIQRALLAASRGPASRTQDAR